MNMIMKSMTVSIMSNKKKKLNRNIRVVFLVYFIMLLLLIGHILFFYFYRSFGIINTTSNPRVFIQDEDVIKGSIVDKNGYVLASSEEGNPNRIYLDYPENYSFAHILGFITNGGLGLEANYSLTLQKVDDEFTNRVKNLFTKDKLHGMNIRLTIDKDFQNYVYNELQVVDKGAVVAIEPSTGKILALASTPSFDPNNVDYTLDDTRYLNRVTQGLYPPGSIFKVISAITIMRNVEDYENQYYTCTGSITIDGATIDCYNNVAHGEVNLSRAIEQSCNTYFAYFGHQLGIEPLVETAIDLGFNKAINFDLQTKISTVSTEEMGTLEIMQTYIGQGNTLVTPLQMAMIYSGIANGGVIMKPYIVDAVLDEDMKVKEKVHPSIYNTSMSTKEAMELNEMLELVVEKGTARSLNDLTFKVAGKTGSAEVTSEVTHGWFAGYAPSDNPKIALAIIFEDSGGSKATLNTVGNIFEYYLENVL